VRRTDEMRKEKTREKEGEQRIFCCSGGETEGIDAFLEDIS